MRTALGVVSVMTFLFLVEEVHSGQFLGPGAGGNFLHPTSNAYFHRPLYYVPQQQQQQWTYPSQFNYPYHHPQLLQQPSYHLAPLTTSASSSPNKFVAVHSSQGVSNKIHQVTSSSSPPPSPVASPLITAVHSQPHPQQQQQFIFPVHSSSQVNKVPRKLVLPFVQESPSYKFKYAVKDAFTGDEKSHEESRNGQNVVGKYTVVEPDGALRVVHYTAGSEGFNAVVERIPGFAPPNDPKSKILTLSHPQTTFLPFHG